MAENSSLAQAEVLLPTRASRDVLSTNTASSPTIGLNAVIAPGIFFQIGSLKVSMPKAILTGKTIRVVVYELA